MSDMLPDTPMEAQHNHFSIGDPFAQPDATCSIGVQRRVIRRAIVPAGHPHPPRRGGLRSANPLAVYLNEATL